MICVFKKLKLFVIDMAPIPSSIAGTIPIVLVAFCFPIFMYKIRGHDFTGVTRLVFFHWFVQWIFVEIYSVIEIEALHIFEKNWQNAQRSGGKSTFYHSERERNFIYLTPWSHIHSDFKTDCLQVFSILSYWKKLFNEWGHI